MNISKYMKSYCPHKHFQQIQEPRLVEKFLANLGSWFQAYWPNSTNS